jgi:hypothetical protein
LVCTNALDTRFTVPTTGSACGWVHFQSPSWPVVPSPWVSMPVQGSILEWGEGRGGEVEAVYTCVCGYERATATRPRNPVNGQ